jgi:hypothetical protein
MDRGGYCCCRRVKEAEVVVVVESSAEHLDGAAVPLALMTPDTS